MDSQRIAEMAGINDRRRNIQAEVKLSKTSEDARVQEGTNRSNRRDKSFLLIFFLEDNEYKPIDG